MGIFRCNKCGYMNEHYYEPGMSEIACPKCTAPVKVYDTLFFVSKLLERYFSVNRELQALKQQEDGREENTQRKILVRKIKIIIRWQASIYRKPTF